MSISYLLSKDEFIYGLIAGIAIALFLASRIPMRKRLHIQNSVALVEDLLKAYRADKENGISTWLQKYAQRNVVYVWGIWNGKSEPSLFALWAAIVTYLGCAFANTSVLNVSDDLKNIVENVFESYIVDKYIGIFKVIDRSVPYLTSNNKTYYYEMIACMIDSTNRSLSLRKDMESKVFPD